MAPWDEQFDGILRRHIPAIAPDDVIPPDAEMVAFGVDSIALLTLMLTLESEYGIRFPMDMLTEDLFRSPQSIWLAVESLSGHA